MEYICTINKDIDRVITISQLPQILHNNYYVSIGDCSVIEKTINSIIHEQFDIYIDFHGIFQSGLIGLLSNIPTRVGKPSSHCKDGAHLFYNIIPSLPIHTQNKYEIHFIVAQSIFSKINPFVHDKELDFETILLAPGSSRVGILKRWDWQNYSALATMLSDIFNKVSIVLGPEEFDLYENFNIDNAKISVLKVNNLIEFDAILLKSSAIIGNDSSFLHLSTYRNIPSLMILGPTKPEVNAPPKFSNGYCHSLQKSCTDQCNVWSGICEHQHCCMKDISVDQIYNKFKQIFKI